MKAAIAVVAVLLCTTAYTKEAPMPVPPIPPTEPPALAAPIPNRSVIGAYQTPGRYSVTLDSGINHRVDPGQGLGFGPGAHYQVDNDRRFMLPGVLLRVPLP